MRRKERKSVDSGTQAGIQVAVGDLVSILQALSTVNQVYPQISKY
jgi:hypothetical protein